MNTRQLLTILLSLLSIGYFGIQLFIEIPRFIIFQNLIYGTLYLVFTYFVARDTKNITIYILLTIIAAFNAGRLSRSIITPVGTLDVEARNHLPLFLLLAIIIYLASKQLLLLAKHTNSQK